MNTALTIAQVFGIPRLCRAAVVGTHARSVLIRITRTHTDQHIKHDFPTLSASAYHVPHIAYQRHVACFNEQATQPGAWRRAVNTLRQAEDDIAHWERQHSVEPALAQAIQWLARAF